MRTKSEHMHEAQIITVILMYIHQSLINALSAHVIHVNLNTMFYAHVEQSPTNAIHRGNLCDMGT